MMNLTQKRNNMDADKILFRCSSLGHIMTDPRSKADKEAGNLSESCKTHLIDVFISKHYHRNTEVQSKFLKKGNVAEEDSITLYSLLNKKYFKKNEEQLKNDFISGTPDLFRGESIHDATEIIDTKTSWDVFTYFRATHKDLADQYYWQGQGYMALSGASKHTVAYCLVNTPWHLISNELFKESYKHPDGTPAAIELNLIANMVYDRKTFEDYISKHGINTMDAASLDIVNGFIEIPQEERMHEFTVERNDADIEKIYQRVKKCREYMNEHLFKSELQTT